MDKVEKLIKQLYSANETKRDEAASKLAKIGDLRAIEPLIECLVDPLRHPKADNDGEVSWAIPTALKNFGELTVKALLPHLRTPHVIWVLGYIGHPSALPALLEARENPEFHEHRGTIQSAISTIKSRKPIR